MAKGVLLRYTTVNERKKMFRRAYNIAQIEFGKMDDKALEVINEYIYGRAELEEVLEEMINYCKGKKKKDSYPLNDNFLNIYGPTKLKRACAAISTIKIIELDQQTFYFSYDAYKRLHKSIFENIFPWAGEERTIDLTKKLEILNGRKLSFMEYENIGINMDTVFTQISDFSLMSNIDQTMSEIFKKINEAEWQEITIEQKCALSARVMGQLWYIHPFIEGNTTLILYTITRLSEMNHFAFSRKILREQHEKVDLRKCILLASLSDNYDVNYMASILLLSNNIEQSEMISKAPPVSERRSIEQLISKAKEEKSKIENEDEEE